MDFQLLICLVLLAGALFWLGRSMFRQTRGKHNCGGGCNKCEASRKMMDGKA